LLADALADVHSGRDQLTTALLHSSVPTDAGAEYSSYINTNTGYNIVQTAANVGQFEAVVKLVEAGASWRLQRGQARVVGHTVMYVPDLIHFNSKSKPPPTVSAASCCCFVSSVYDGSAECRVLSAAAVAV
jgi:hypothetical protein